MEEELKTISAEEFKLICTGHYYGEDSHSVYYKTENGFETIVLENLKVDGSVELKNNYEIEKSLVLINVVFTCSIYSHRTNYKNGLHFNKCEFHKKVEFFLDSFKSDLTFINNKFQEGFIVFSCNTKGDFISSYNTHHKTTRYIYGNYGSSILIEGDIHSRDLIIEQNTIGGKLSLQGLFYSNIEIANTTCNSISQIGPSVILGELSIKSSDLKKLFIKRPSPTNKQFFINTLSISGITPKTLFISDLSINNLVLRDAILSSSSVFTLSNIQPHRVVLANSTVLGNINLITVRGKSFEHAYACNLLQNTTDKTVIPVPSSSQAELVLSHSILGDTSLTDCDLTEFGVLRYITSNILNVSLTGCQLPLTVKIEVNELEHLDLSVNKNEQLQTLLSQLKQIYYRQGDQPESSRYHAFEIEAHRKKLQSENDWRSLPERFTLFLNRWSNNHGTSWELALGFTTALSIILFTCYALSLGFRVDLSWNGVKYFFDIASHIGEFIFPFHKPGFMSESYIGAVENGWSRLWDMLGRIFISYGIYQLVQAFRKHGRR